MNKTMLRIGISLVIIATAIALIAPLGVGAQFVATYGTPYYSGYNARPVWNKIPNLSVVQGETASVSAMATDDNGDQLFYSALQLPVGGSFNPTTRVFSMTPNFTQLGSFPVTLSVTDNKGAPVTTTFYVSVSTNYSHYAYGGGDVDEYYNQAPYFSSDASYYAVNSGNELRFKVNAFDPEGDAIRYRVSELPAGASFDAPTRTFSWTPARSQRGTYTLIFTAMDAVRTSIPFSVTVVVDNATTPVSSVAPNYYYPNYTNTATATIAPTNKTFSAVAGQTFLHDFGRVDSAGRPFTVTLITAPTGATMTNNVLTWNVPSNAVNKEYPFSVSAHNGIALVTMDFNVLVTGGAPTVKTVYTAPKVTTQTVVAAPVQQQIIGDAVYITTGRTVVPVNYQYTDRAAYTATAYGSFVGTTATIYGAPVPMTLTGLDIFNIAVRVNGDKEMIVSWDTSKPATGEVVFGYASQSRGSDLNRTILNYDFTTGVVKSATTRQEVTLGRLDLNQTYYLRVIARADNQTEISREIVFIPMTTEEGSIIIDQRPGAASALGALSSFLISGGFLFFLVLVVIMLIAYLLFISRRSAPAGETGSHEEEIPLNIHHPAEHH